MGYILLEGGGEFGGRMSEPDLLAIELAGGFDAPIRIIPAAAAPDNNHARAGKNGSLWFHALGARDVEVLNVIDGPSANNPEHAAAIRISKLVYLLGGFPRHLGETLLDSLVWQATLEAYHSGAVIAGSSAGAMVLCEHYYDPYEKKLLPGLSLLPNACVMPHHNRSGKTWTQQLIQALPGSVLVGIDEATGMINVPAGRWTVSGGGEVTLYRTGWEVSVHARGQQFTL